MFKSEVSVLSGKASSAVPTGGTPEDAEEFMALMLLAQKEQEHDCKFIRYFRKVGDRMLTKYDEEK